MPIARLRLVIVMLAVMASFLAAGPVFSAAAKKFVIVMYWSGRDIVVSIPHLTDGTDLTTIWHQDYTGIPWHIAGLGLAMGVALEIMRRRRFRLG